MYNSTKAAVAGVASAPLGAADGPGEALEELEVRCRDPELVVEVGLDQTTSHRIVDVADDGVEHGGQGGFEMPVLACVRSQFVAFERARLPASVEGVGEEPAVPEHLDEDGVYLCSEHGGMVPARHQQ